MLPRSCCEIGGQPAWPGPGEQVTHENHANEQADVGKHEPRKRALRVGLAMPWNGPPPPFYPSAEHSPEERGQLNAVIDAQLYLTNYRGAENLEALKAVGCTHIAAVGSEFLDNKDNRAASALKARFWNCDITDDEEQADSMAEALRTAAGFIHKALKKKKNCVVVHCAAGVSRSSTIVLGYLMLHTDRSLRDAFAHVIACRPCIWPNDGFMRALVRLEMQLRGGLPSLTLEEYEHWGDYDGPAEESATEREESMANGHEESLSQISSSRRGLSKQERRRRAVLATEEARLARFAQRAISDKWKTLTRKTRKWKWRQMNGLGGRLVAAIGGAADRVTGRRRRRSRDTITETSKKASQVVPAM